MQGGVNIIIFARPSRTVASLMIGGLVLVVGAGKAWGQCQALEVAKLLASDGASLDEFGFSVAMDGDLAVIGAYWDDDNGTDSGSAYVFHFDGSGWVEQAKLLPDDGAAQEFFGRSVAISGETVVIGAPRDDDLGTHSGSAYVFRFHDSRWAQEKKLLPPVHSSFDSFGCAVAIDGDAVVIGAMGDGDDAHFTDIGSAYIFRFNGQAWFQQAHLWASDAAEPDHFGWSVAISGDTTVIGAPYNEDRGEHTGSAYVFHFDGSSWAEQTKLLPPDSVAWDEFGASVAISDDTAVIGAYGDDDRGDQSGSAYVFRFNGSHWIQEAKLLAFDGAEGDSFACSVAVDGDQVVIGEYFDDDSGSDSGSAYVFGFDGSSWVEQAKLLASDGAADKWFGTAVAVSGERAMIGAGRDSDNSFSAGSAYVFGGLADCNSNYTLDICDIASEPNLDCNCDGVIDNCSGGSVDPCPNDCNMNGLPDCYDMVSGTSHDCNGDAVPDECETMDGGDFDADGDADLGDFAVLVECLAGPEVAPTPPSSDCVGACLAAFDFDADNDLDLADFAGFQLAFSGRR